MGDAPEKSWERHIGRLRGDPESKALGLCFALAGEVFLLKAENQRLRLALERHGTLDTPSLESAGESAEFRAWLAREQAVFTRSLFQAWMTPDQSPDVSGEYEKELTATT